MEQQRELLNMTLIEAEDVIKKAFLAPNIEKDEPNLIAHIKGIVNRRGL